MRVFFLARSGAEMEDEPAWRRLAVHADPEWMATPGRSQKPIKIGCNEGLFQ